MRRARSVIGGFTALVLGAVLAGCQPPPPLDVDYELLSPNTAGTDGGDGTSLHAFWSPDGTNVVFESYATNLAGHHPLPWGTRDIFVRDLTTDTTSLVSINADGTQGGSRDSYEPIFSPDGTKIAFTSEAVDFGPPDGNFGHTDIFLRDLTTGTTSLVTFNAAGTGAANSSSAQPSFSPDGTKVAFTSLGSDFGPTDQTGQWDVYVRDMTTGTTSLVTTNAAGTDAANGWSMEPEFSPDGSRIAFASLATDLGPTDLTARWDIYVHDLTTGTTSLASPNAAGTSGGNGDSQMPVWSPDGTRIAFQSGSNNLGPPDSGVSGQDVYVRDLAAGATTLASTSPDGTAGGNRTSDGAVFSPDGGRIAFRSEASNLHPLDTNVMPDVFVRDLDAGVTSLVSVNRAGTASGSTSDGNSSSEHASFDPSGRLVVFSSIAEDLVATDSNGTTDTFVRDLAAGTTRLLSSNAAGTDSADNWSGRARFSPDGFHLVMESSASDLGPTDPNRTGDIYLVTLHGADLAVELRAMRGSVVSEGGPIAYDLTFTNHGPDPAEGVSAMVLLPTGIDPATVGTVDCAIHQLDEPWIVRCPLGDMAVGEQRSAMVTATVTAPAGSTLTAAAAITSPGDDPAVSNNVAAVTVLVE